VSQPNLTALTPLSFLERSAVVWADKVAVVDEEASMTYSELGASVMRFAQALRLAGLKEGDRVACLLPNTSVMLMAHFAVPLAGCVLVAVNTRLSESEVAYILQHSGATALVVDAAYAATANAALDQGTDVSLVVWSGDAKRDELRGVEFDDFCGTATGEGLEWTVEDENSVISINYTSGTTGRPKGVMYTHRGAYLNALGEVIHSGFRTSSVYLWTLPMFHCNGWCTPWAVTAIGARHVCLREVRADLVWEMVAEQGVTHFNAAPTVVTAVLNSPRATKLDTPITVTTAGAPPSPTTISQMESMGFSIVHVYGLTEVYGPYTVCEAQHSWPSLDIDARARLVARQGVSMIQAGHVRVVDPEMRDVVPNGEAMGEIVMRGNNVMKGYFLDEEGTEGAFLGGWFHTGDLGVMHPDGYVELRDRAKDVVISGGENISTVEVEQALMTHPAVLEVAVIGVPDEKWGERPKAFVVPRTGMTATEVELIEHVRSRIAHYKAPREVEIVSELPKTSTGKIQKYVLRDAEWVGSTRRING
jgi:fatty-acyl-CoA synthase